MKIAVRHGFKPGTQLPGSISEHHKPLYFADQNWKKPNKDKYVEAVRKYKPTMATVIDWERAGQLPVVLEWAEEIADTVEYIVVVPKVVGGIPLIPDRIGGKQVVLGYSVPTKYGGTPVPPWEFGGRLVHLLGGSPHRQQEYWRSMCMYATIMSMDGNYHNMKATKFCEFWQNGKWIPLTREGGEIWGENAPYEAFERSCINIRRVWDEL